MRNATIKSRCQKLIDLYEEYSAIERNAEAEYGFVTQKAQAKADKVLARYEKLRDDTIATLHARGLCSEEGITSDEANNPLFANVEGLHEIGDGCWC